MRRIPTLLLALSVAAGLTGCSREEVTEPQVFPRPVKSLVIDDVDAGGTRSFPARIAAAQRADLAFRVAGTVQELPVREGDRLKQGDLVAKLDPKDYQIVVNDRRATFDKARKNYDRGQQLVSSGAISKVDFDRLEAEFKNAQAALEAASQDLAYTELTAPFDGMVARRLVDRFEEVQARQAIAVLQNVETLEVKFDVPESIIRGLRAASDQEQVQARQRVRVTATFDDQPERQFPLQFKEIATKADDKTQTFEATYLMEQWDSGLLLPGMTATVVVDFAGMINRNLIYRVPVGAVVGDYKLDPRVWTIDQNSMTVKPQPVKTGRLVGSEIEVTEGLQPGMRIVTAGTPFLSEGMPVQLMPESEQAEPRPEDLKYQ